MTRPSAGPASHQEHRVHGFPFRPGLLDGCRIVGIGIDDTATARRLAELKATVLAPPDDLLNDEEQAAEWARAQTPVDALVCDSAPAFAAHGLQPALEQAWRAARAVATGAVIGADRPARLLFLAPAPAAGPHAGAARAALENLARTLSVEWARYGVTAVAIWPGGAAGEEDVARLVCFVASPAGGYLSGCRLDLTRAS